MASFAQQSRRQYPTYQPLIDSDTYGKALAHTDSQYQAGAQKVQNSIISLAGLPVSTDRERQYLQQKVDAATSLANETVGQEWSDQKISNRYTKMISSLAGDKNIQVAISNASARKHWVDDISNDDDASKGKNTANKWAFNKQWQDFELNGKLGEKFDGNYSSYVDVDDWADKRLSKIKPQWRKIETPAHDTTDPTTGKFLPSYQQYNKVTNTWEEVPENQVRSVIELGIRNSPEIVNQMRINADYSLKDYTEDDFAKHQEQVNQSQIVSNSKSIDGISDYINGLTSVPKDLASKYKTVSDLKTDLNKQIDSLKRENQTLSTYDYNADRLLFRDPTTQQQIKNALYKQSWILQQVGTYAGVFKKSIEYDGDPLMRSLAYKNHQLAVSKYNSDETQRRIENDRADKEEARKAREEQLKERKEKLEEMKTLGYLGNNGEILMPLSSDLLGHEYKTFTANLTSKRSKYDSDFTDFLVSKLGNRVDEYYTKNYDANGNLSYTPKDIKKIAELEDKFLSVRKADGKPVDIEDGLKLPMYNKDITLLNDLLTQKRVIDNYDKADKEQLSGAFLKTGNDWEDNVKKKYGDLSPMIIDLAKSKYDKNKSQLYQDIRTLSQFNTISKDLKLEDDGQAESNKILDKYNTDAQKLHQFLQYYYQYQTNYNQIEKTLDTYNKSQENKEKFLNDRAKQLNLVPNVFAKPILSGDSKADDRIKQNIANVIESSGSNVPTIIKDIAGNVEVDKKWGQPVLETYFNPITKKWVLRGGYSARSEDTFKEYTLNDAEATALSSQGFINPTTASKYEDYISSLVTTSPYKSTYSTGQPSWEESISLGLENGVETRFGITHDKNGYHYHTWINGEEQPDIPLGENIGAIAQDITERINSKKYNNK